MRTVRFHSGRDPTASFDWGVKTGLVAAAIVVFLAGAALANPGGIPNGGVGNNNGNGNAHGAPGPLAGAGLPFLIAAGVAGAYKLLWRRDKSAPNQRRGEQL